MEVTGKYGTPYADTEILLAVMSGDEDDARRMLADFLPGELDAFYQHISRLQHLIRKRFHEIDDRSL